MPSLLVYRWNRRIRRRRLRRRRCPCRRVDVGDRAQTPLWNIYSHTHTHPFNDPLSGTTRVSRYQKGKTNLDFTEARDSEWQWHQLGHMQVCTSLQTDNHDSTPPLVLQARCPSCRPTNSIRALKAKSTEGQYQISTHINMWNDDITTTACCRGLTARRLTA